VVGTGAANPFPIYNFSFLVVRLEDALGAGWTAAMGARRAVWLVRVPHLAKPRRVSSLHVALALPIGNNYLRLHRKGDHTYAPRRDLLRVSTDRQTTENQLQRLREVAERANWHLVDVYEEVVSGAAARNRRAAYDRMLRDATRRRFEVLLAWDVSRLGRSLRELLECFETLRGTGVDLYLDQQGVDTTTPAGRALFGMAGVFAEFERSMLIERTRAGLDRARAQGKRLGRPVTPDHVTRRVHELRRAGLGMDRIARELDIGKSVAQRICQAMPAAGVCLSRPN
jgi:DNA invertase Pin-like site-specific DNA recombinase